MKESASPLAAGACIIQDVERSRSFRKLFFPVLICLGLLGLILTPRPLAGLFDRERAGRAMLSGSYSQAASDFAAAAERLPWQPSLWERAGIAAVMAGQPREAIAFLETAQARGSISAWGWIYLGMAYDQAGNLSAGMAAWQRALPLAEAFGNLGKAEQRLGDFPAAIADWRASLAQEPDSAAGHYNLGLLLATTDPAAAYPELQQAASLNPDLQAPIESLHADMDLALLSEDRAYQLVVAGRALAAAGYWDLAAEAFRNATAARGDYAEAWAWLGEACQHLGQEGGADIEKAVALDPNSALVQSLAGIYWQRQGQTGAALAAFRKAADLDPQNAAWQVALGSVYEQAGDLVSALDHYGQAVTLAPQDASTWKALAAFSVNNSVDVAGTGFPAAQKLLALAPDDWQARDLAGQATLDQGNRRDAEQQFLIAIGLAPAQAAPHLHLAWVYLLGGDLVSAQDQLFKAHSLDPDGSSGWQAQRLLDQYFPGP